MLLQRNRSGGIGGRRRGAVVVLTAICLVVLIGALALSIDGGTMLDRRRHLQASADAAALSGVADLFKRYVANRGVDTGGTAQTCALAISAANGYNNDYANNPDSYTNKVTVNIPPLTGIKAGKPGCVEVIIEYRETRRFSGVFGSGKLPVVARAVAGCSYDSLMDGIICLDGSVSGSLNAHGGAAARVIGAPVIVNSNDNSAAISNGSASTTLTAPAFYVTGNYVSTGSSQFIGTMNVGTRPVPDPLAFLLPPTVASLPTGTITSKNQQGGGKTYTLTPGVYNGGLSFGGQDSVIMQPGVYYMNAGGFSFSGQGSLTAQGVMLYNAPNKNSQSISITGQGAVIISPMTSGPYAGISFFEDRAGTAPINIAGSGMYNIKGTYYAANAPISLSGNGDSNVGSQFICRTLDLGGNGALNIDYTANVAPAVRVIQLVE